jgi:hypothetical protein
MALRPTPLAAFALAAALLGALGACGSGDKPAGSPGDTVRTYNAAIADGKSQRACAQLDATAQKELQDAVQGAARASCKDVIGLLAGFYDQATKDRLRAAKVEVKTTGGRASATFPSPTALGGPQGRQTYELKREGGRWKIDRLNLKAD